MCVPGLNFLQVRAFQTILQHHLARHLDSSSVCLYDQVESTENSHPSVLFLFRTCQEIKCIWPNSKFLGEQVQGTKVCCRLVSSCAPHTPRRKYTGMDSVGVCPTSCDSNVYTNFGVATTQRLCQFGVYRRHCFRKRDCFFSHPAWSVRVSASHVIANGLCRGCFGPAGGW